MDKAGDVDGSVNREIDADSLPPLFRPSMHFLKIHELGPANAGRYAPSPETWSWHGPMGWDRMIASHDTLDLLRSRL